MAVFPERFAKIVLFVTLTTSVSQSAFSSKAEAAERPNIILFLVDDLGWADLGCYGSELHETPNIDALAASGMRFTQAYAACPVCSPTRASILTGRHPVRVDITDWIPGMRASRVNDRRFQHVNDRDNLALSEVTLAEHLKEAAGYDTYFLGKWHLGDEGHWPTDQGFDVNIGGCEKGSPPGGYYAPWNNPNLTAKENEEYLTTRLTDEAVQLVQQSSERPTPFFMMFSYYNVHTPITPDRRTISHFKIKSDTLFDGPTPVQPEGDGYSRMRQDNAEYASMVRAVDLSVGRVLEAVEQAGQTDDTIIVFFSDNGGLCTTRRAGGGPNCNLPLRSGKGWLYEGGIREPMIIRAPGVTEPGAVSDMTACSTDFYPTLLELADLPLQPNLHADGQSLVKQLRGEQDQPRTLHWHYPHYHGSAWKPGAAIRDGNMKLIEFYETGDVELYDLEADAGEQRNLADQMPEVRDRLSEKLRNWQKKLSAKMPQPVRSNDRPEPR